MSQNTPELDHLIARCRDRHEDAWTALFHMFADDVARWLTRLDYTVREDDIADLRQDVFVKVVRSFSGYNADESSFSKWLYFRTREIAIDHLRKHTAGKRTPPDALVPIHHEESEGQPPADPPEPGPGPHELAAQNDEHRLLFQALEKLDSRCRDLIELVHLGGFTYEHVGEMLKMNAKTVGTALTRCKDHLRDVIAKIFSRGGFEGPTTA